MNSGSIANIENTSPSHNCVNCPVMGRDSAAGPAIVRLSGDGASWSLQPSGTPVHLAVLFRDPAIRDGRSVPTVLDLRLRSNESLVTGRSCWARQFLSSLPGLPLGITIALDNGVRCPCPRKLKFAEYHQRASKCHEATATWHASLRHPDGTLPGIVLCDRHLAISLAKLRILTNRDGSTWRCRSRFIDSVGDEVTYLGADTLIAAHPVVLLRKPAYRDIFSDRKIVDRVRALARLPVVT